MTRYVVAAVGDIPNGKSKLVVVNRRPVALFNVGGEFFAFLNICPHARADLCSGSIVGLVQSNEPGHYVMSRKGEFLRCSRHGWEFDLRTGQSWFDPSHMKMKRYQTDVKGGGELTKGPYVAETFPVFVEKDYVVVEM